MMASWLLRRSHSRRHPFWWKALTCACPGPDGITVVFETSEPLQAAVEVDGRRYESPSATRHEVSVRGLEPGKAYRYDVVPLQIIESPTDSVPLRPRAAAVLLPLPMPVTPAVAKPVASETSWVPMPM